MTLLQQQVGVRVTFVQLLSFARWRHFISQSCFK